MQRIFILLCFSRSIRSLIRFEETLNELADALEKLPQRERDLIILHYYTGLTLKEVAVKMSMSYSNTKLVHNKALMLLRNRMDID